MSARILVVDDEAIVVDVVRRYLDREGFQVESAADGATALDKLATWRPDLVVLDLMLPEVDGMEFFRRSGGSVPVIMLTAKGDEADRVLGLELGADDYVTKPFRPRELVARVKSVLRRVHQPADTTPPAALGYPGLRIDPASRTVEVGTAEVSFTAKEFDLLAFLARRPGRVFTRDQLFENVWADVPLGESATVTVHVRRVREKIEDDPSQPRWIQTVWGVGYKFVAP